MKNFFLKESFMQNDKIADIFKKTLFSFDNKKDKNQCLTAIHKNDL